MNIEENSIIILSTVKEKQTDDSEDEKMTNKDIDNKLNLILNEMNSFKTEIKEVKDELKKVNSRLDKVEDRLNNLESYVKEEFVNINTKFDDHMEKYHSKG